MESHFNRDISDIIILILAIISFKHKEKNIVAKQFKML